MTVPPAWRKSSYSGGTANTNCVEVAGLTEAVAVRDSKNPHSGHLTLSPEAFAGLLARVKHDDLSA
jgi:hypothetical protein